MAHNTVTEHTLHAEGQQHTRCEACAMDRMAEALTSGRAFVMGATSQRSRRGYEPPLGRREWSDAMAALANMARESDALAQVAAAIIGKVNLYGTSSQAGAAIYEGAFQAVVAEYDDVIGRSGPEGGRFKPRPYTLNQCIAIRYHVAEAVAAVDHSTLPGPGWVVERLAIQHHVNVYGLKRVNHPVTNPAKAVAS